MVAVGSFVVVGPSVVVAADPSVVAADLFVVVDPFVAAAVVVDWEGQNVFVPPRLWSPA